MENPAKWTQFSVRILSRPADSITPWSKHHLLIYARIVFNVMPPVLLCMFMMFEVNFDRMEVKAEFSYNSVCLVADKSWVAGWQRVSDVTMNSNQICVSEFHHTKKTKQKNRSLSLVASAMSVTRVTFQLARHSEMKRMSKRSANSD